MGYRAYQGWGGLRVVNAEVVDCVVEGGDGGGRGEQDVGEVEEVGEVGWCCHLLLLLGLELVVGIIGATVG